MGRLNDAREIVIRLRSITSTVLPDASFLRVPEHREALPVGPTVGGRRDNMSAGRRLAAILAADAAGHRRLMGGEGEGNPDRIRHQMVRDRRPA